MTTTSLSRYTPDQLLHRIRLLLSVLLHQCLDFLGAHYPVVDSDVVNQAGEEGAGFHRLATANIKATI
jgi:hypothetical protein